MPKAGQLTVAANQVLVAPLEIKSSSGTNYLVKLVEANNGKEALTVFIRGGIPVNIKVPLGKFVVKYASGKTWYGEDSLFGPETQFAQASEVFEFSSEISAAEMNRLLHVEREINIFDVNFKQFLLSQGMFFQKSNYRNQLQAKAEQYSGYSITFYKVKNGNL